MSRCRTAVLAAAALCTMSSAGSAQSAGVPAGADQAPNWTLDTPGPTARPKKKGAAAGKGVPQAAAPQSEEAARLAAARKRFFEKPGDEATSDGPNYTGLRNTNGLYDHDAGGFHPSGAFKF